MSACMCFVQEEQISAEQRHSLASRLDDFTTRHFGSAVDLRWIEIAKGSGYTAGKLSNTSCISLTANRPLEQSSRAELLLELCSLWAEEAKCSLDHVLAVLRDPH